MKVITISLLSSVRKSYCKQKAKSDAKNPDETTRSNAIIGPVMLTCFKFNGDDAGKDATFTPLKTARLIALTVF